MRTRNQQGTIPLKPISRPTANGRGGRARLASALLVALALHALLLLVPLRDAPRSHDERPLVISHLDLDLEQRVEPKPLDSDDDWPRTIAVASEAPVAQPEHEDTRTEPLARSDSKPREAGLETKADEGRPEEEATVAKMEPHALEAKLPREETKESEAAPAKVYPEQPPDLAELELFPHDIIAGLVQDESIEVRGRNLGEILREPTIQSQEDQARMAERRLAAFVRDEQARHRVQTGLIDPYFIRLREAFDSGFAPVWKHLDEDSGEGLPSDLEAWLRDYQGSMRRYAETGTPYHEEESSSIGSHHPLAQPVAPAGTMGFADTRHDMRQQQMMSTLFLDIARGRAAGLDLVAFLRVTQSSNGVLLRVEIDRSSGRRAYDDLARETIRTSLASPRIPERAGEGLGLTGEKIESLWAFRTRFVVAPPMPMAVCEFDTDGIEGDCIKPLQRRVLPRIELEAVY